jgi:hypothetical protein
MEHKETPLRMAWNNQDDEREFFQLHRSLNNKWADR